MKVIFTTNGQSLEFTCSEIERKDGLFIVKNPKLKGAKKSTCPELWLPMGKVEMVEVLEC